MRSDHDLGYAKVDLHRHRRQGFPEAVYCPGKSPAQVVRIAAELLRGGGPVRATRVTPPVAAALRRRFRGARHHPVARL
ncbi:MAG: 1-(5-phosphoribosyl)-5-amino-4-imidazole-carboxylate carboxylase, partial [bacterium]